MDTPTAPVSTPAAPSTPASTPSSAPSTPAASTPRAQPVNPASPGRTLADQVRKVDPSAAKPDTAPAGGGETAAEKALRLKLKYKVDGQEIEEELDEHEIRMRIQKAHGSEKRFEEAAKLRKQWQEATEFGKKNLPEAVKQLFGVDLDEWAESRLEERFTEATMPEEQRERLQLQRELERYKAEKAELEEANKSRAQQEYEKRVWQETETSYLEAFKRSGLDPQYARQHLMPLVAEIAEAALDQGLDLSPDDVVKAANKRLNTVAQKAVRGLKGDSLLSFLGEDVVKEVLRARLDKARVPAAPPAPVQPREPQDTPDRIPGRRSMTPTDFRRKHMFGL